MHLESGARLGPYEILARVGAGGMGEVFRARDTRLDRTVAVKTLPAELARNAQLKLRFQREAKAISALSHPNICALYDVGEHEGVDYLVMEFLEGETLAERLARGPLPLKDALRIGIEIAAALERAHREGVVHRDLKPGNVMLTKSGAKLLDFGLAKTAEAHASISADAPTVQHDDKAPLTAEGTIVGTFQYMAPEQIEGAAVDARTDIFALGALLYEMVTGTRAFGGKTRTSLIASIVAGEPRPISELVPVAPAQLEHVVQRCLEKEPDARWQSVHDLRLELEWIAKNAEGARKQERRRPIWPWVALAAAIAIASAVAAFVWRRPAVTPRALQTHILAPRDQTFTVVMDSLSISPDGRYVTFGVQNDKRLWLRPLGSLEARPIGGTEDGVFPFWSPDSRWIAFFDESRLRKVNLSGAPPVTLCEAPRGRTGAWSEDGVIYFSPAATVGLYRVSANGGVAEPVTQLDKTRKETTHRWPLLLPGGKKLLYLAGTHEDAVGSEANVLYLASLDDLQKRTVVARIRSNVAFARGHLLFVKDQVLVAQPFDPERGALTGEPFKIAENIEYDAEYFRGAFATTEDGLLIYRTLASPPQGQLAWSDGKGGAVPFGPTLAFHHVNVSPDGKRVAASVTDRATGLDDIWVFDVERQTQTRVTSTPGSGEGRPIWSPDGTQLVFSRHVGFQVGGDLILAHADGSGGERVIYSGKTVETDPTDWLADGRLLFTETEDEGADRRDDVMLLQMGSPAAPRRILAGPSNERRATFSPDGRFIAFIADDSGVPHAYAAPLADPTRRFQITSRIALDAFWLREGIGVFGPDGLFVMPVQTEGLRVTPGTERALFKPNPGVYTGHVMSLEKILLGQVVVDRYDEVIAVTTDWQKR